MSALSDVRTLYDSVRSTWVKSQADVIAHLMLLFVLFVVCDVTIPEVTIPPLDAVQITNNEWFKLAKDSGLLYLSLVVPVVAIVIYAAVLRAVGQLLVFALSILLPLKPKGNLWRFVSSPVLEPLALSLKQEDFDLGDLFQLSTHLTLKYQVKRSEVWDAFQESLQSLSKNGVVYLGDFTVFLTAWIGIFLLAPGAAWTQVNRDQFWPVALVLVCLVAFAWFRVSRALAAVPGLQLLYVSMMVRADPDMASQLDVPEERRARIRSRLDELLAKEKEKADHGPSLRGFLRYRLGLEKEGGEQLKLRVRGWPFPALYKRGSRFSYDELRNKRYDSAWFGDYAAYVYYWLHRRVSTLARSLWQLARYIVTGVP